MPTLASVHICSTLTHFLKHAVISHVAGVEDQRQRGPCKQWSREDSLTGQPLAGLELGPNLRSFGSAGGGGQFVWADPDARLALAHLWTDFIPGLDGLRGEVLEGL